MAKAKKLKIYGHGPGNRSLLLVDGVDVINGHWKLIRRKGQLWTPGPDSIPVTFLMDAPEPSVISEHNDNYNDINSKQRNNWG